MFNTNDSDDKNKYFKQPHIAIEKVTRIDKNGE